MKDDTMPDASEPVARPLQRPVGPIAWCSRPNGGSFVSDESRNNVPIYREVYNVPLYGRADLDAAVAAERERWAPLRAMAMQVVDADDKQELTQQMIDLLRAAVRA